MESFLYEPLNLEVPAFRIVRVLPGGPDDDIECELIHAFFNVPETQIPYEALSYSWGSPIASEEISLDGCSFYVTRNLHAALLHLRHEDRPRDMWVDALSIDQNNVRERGHQVQQMADVYKTADRVIFWLGSDIWQAEALMNVVKAFEIESREQACNDWELNDPRWKELWSVALRSMPKSSAVLREGFDLLLRRSWWSRVWILQEVANARAGVVMFGNLSISARVFAVVPHLLQIAPNAHCQAVLDIFPGTFRYRSWWAEQRDLRTLLLKFQHSAASDSRDKVYALLGLSSDAYKTDLLAADYDKTLEDVVKTTLSFLFSYHVSHIQLTALPNGFVWSDFPVNLRPVSAALLFNAVSVGQEDEVKLLVGQDIVNANSVDDQGRTPLAVAALRNRLGIVLTLISLESVNPNPKDNLGRTLLSHLAEMGNDSMTECILSRPDADIHTPDSDGRVPLWYSIKNGFVDVTRLLIVRGGFIPDQIHQPVSSSEKPSSLLIHALQVGKDAMIRQIIDAIGIEWKDYVGRTMLSYAAELGLSQKVEFLLGHDNIDVNTKSAKGRTPLSFAAENGRTAVASLLLRRTEIDVNAESDISMTPLNYASSQGHADIVKLLVLRDDVDVNLASTSGASPINMAIRNGDSKVMSLLLRRNDLSLRPVGQGEFTPLHHVVFRMRATFAESHPEAYPQKQKLASPIMFDILMQLLQRDGINTNARCHLGRTPLSYAAGADLARAVEILLGQTDIDINLADRRDTTPLSYAASSSSLDVIVLLLGREDIKVNLVDDIGRPSLSYAAMGRKPDTVKLLLGHEDIDVNLADGQGRTPLSYAVTYDRENGMPNAVDFLLGRGDIDINLADLRGRTPLSYAAQHGDLSNVKALLKRTDIDIGREDNRGKPASWYAEVHNRQAALDALLKASAPLKASAR